MPPHFRLKGSVANGAFTLSELVGGTIGISIASTVFGSKLASGLREFAPDAPFELVRQNVQVSQRFWKQSQGCCD